MSAKPTAPAPTPPEIDIASLEATAATPLEAFLDRNFKRIAYGILGLIVAGSVYGLVQYRGKQAALQAALEATQAKTVQDCKLVADKYKGTVAGGNALLTKAKLEWQENKKDTAIASLREFKANYASHPFYQQGVLALASRLEAVGGNEAKEAQTLFEELAKNKDSELAGLAQMRLGDLLWSQGKEDEAKKIYDELPRKFQGKFDQFFEDNKKRLDWLAAALPTKEVDAPKIPDALKAPAPAPGGANVAPAINITPGKAGQPATSAPFEVKMNPPNTKVGAPTIKLNASKPSIAPQPQLKIAPATDGKSPLTTNGAPAPANSATPTLNITPQVQPKLELKPQAPAAPAPAAPAKAEEAPKK
jgi:predicted negative regulator of RcsB-dependent stress response